MLMCMMVIYDSIGNLDNTNISGNSQTEIKVISLYSTALYVLNVLV